jgi:hypothetical protein
MYEMVLDKKILYHASQGGEFEIIFLLGGRVGSGASWLGFCDTCIQWNLLFTNLVITVNVFIFLFIFVIVQFVVFLSGSESV